MNGFCSYIMYHMFQRQSLCNISKEFHNYTHLQIMQKSVYLWDSGGESGGWGAWDHHNIFLWIYCQWNWSWQLVTCVLTWCPKVYVYWQPDQWSRAAFTWTFRGFVYESLSPHACRLQLLNSEFRRHGRLVTPGLECLWHEHQMEFYKLHICKIWYK